MANIYTELNDQLTTFIKAQQMFFVASAPLSGEGHVNVSPKGHDSFTVIDRQTVAYLDLGGSGIETHAHVVENGRITLMFCAFDGKANIVRLYGRGEVYDFNHSDHARLKALFPMAEKARSVIRVKLTRISDSCGWGVPLYDFKAEREQLIRWSNHQSETDWQEKRYVANSKSIDGLPGLVKPQ